MSRFSAVRSRELLDAAREQVRSTAELLARASAACGELRQQTALATAALAASHACLERLRPRPAAEGA